MQDELYPKKVEISRMQHCENKTNGKTTLLHVINICSTKRGAKIFDISKKNITFAVKKCVMITTEEIKSLLADTESYRVERTISTTDMDKFCQAICAFSNDIAGSRRNGYLIIGAHDNGELSGLAVDDHLLLHVGRKDSDREAFIRYAHV
jgi:hypothetical protein